MRGISLSLAMAVLVSAIGACNVGRSLRDCDGPTDCPRGSTCDVEGRFCTDASPVLVGVSLPLSGTYSAIGQDAKAAIDYATKLVNEGGGVRKRGIEFRVMDDASDPNVATQNIKTLIAAGAVAIIGPMTSGQVVPSQEATYASKTVQLTPYAGAQILGTLQPEGDRYLFQAITNIEHGSAAAIALRMGGFGCDRGVVIRTDDTTGADYTRAIRELYMRAATPACIAKDIVIPTTEKSGYGDELDALTTALDGAAKPCAAIVSSAPIAGKILREFRARKTPPDVHWFASSTLHSDSFINASKTTPSDTTTAAEGAYVADIEVVADQTSWLSEQVGRANGSSSPPALSNFFLHTFDAVVVIALAVEIAPALTDPRGLRDALVEVGRNDGTEETYTPRRIGTEGFGPVLSSIRQRGLTKLNYDGATGPLEFDAFGVVGNVMREWKVTGTSFTADESYDTQRINDLINKPPPKQTCSQ